MGHQQSASISGFQNNGNGTQTMNGLLAPARSQHNRAVSLPVFAQQINGFQEGANGGDQQRRGHQYQSSFSGGMGNGNAYGLAINDGMGGGMNGLNGWAEEEVVGN